MQVLAAGGDPEPPQCHVGQEPGWEATADKARNQLTQGDGPWFTAPLYPNAPDRYPPGDGTIAVRAA